MPFVKTRDHQDLYVKDWGSGRPVILLHGWPLTADSWDDQALALAQAGYRVIAYDRRGFGRSSQPLGGYDYDTFTADLAGLLESLGVRDAVLVGFSMGGGEVARYRSRHGGKGIVQAGLISSVAGYLLKDDTNPDGVDESVFDDQMKAPILKDRAAFFTTFAQQFYGVGYITSPVSEAPPSLPAAEPNCAGLSFVGKGPHGDGRQPTAQGRQDKRICYPDRSA